MSVSEQPLGVCAEHYFRDCAARDQSDRTIESKRSAIGFFIRWCVTQRIVTLKDIDTTALERYRCYVSEYRVPHSQQLLERSTKRNRLTAVMVFLRRTFKLFNLTNCPSEGFELPKASRRLPKGVLSDQEVRDILNQVEHFGQYKYRDRAIIEMYWATSMRRRELARLTISDVDTDSLTVCINRGKGDKDRVIPVNERACRFLNDYLVHDRPKLASFSSGDALFLNNDGVAYKDRQLTALVNHYKRRAGVTKKGACNLFRHTGATRMLERGADIRVIQEQLGHADISTTQIYVHVAITNLKKVYQETHPSNFV